MLRLRSCLAGLLAALVSIALGTPAHAGSRPGGPNLVVNGRFDGFTGWTRTQHSDFKTYLHSDSFPDDGTGSLRADGVEEDSPDSWPVAWQCLDVQPGIEYRFTAAMRMGPGHQIDLGAEGGWITVAPAAAEPGCEIAGDRLTRFDNEASGYWVQESHNFVMPAGVTRVRVTAYVRRASQSSFACCDEHNSMLFDAVGLHELQSDVQMLFDPPPPSDAPPLAVVDIPLSVRNLSDHTAHPQRVTVAHDDRLQIAYADCAGSVDDVDESGSHYFLWHDLPVLSPNQTLRCTIRARVKSGFAGDLLLRASALNDNEADHSNNLAYHTLQILAAPDISVGVSTTEFPQAGGAVQAVVTIANLGTATGTPLLDFAWSDGGGTVTLPDFNDSCNEFFYDSGTGIANVAVAAGATRTCTLSFTWPSSQSEDLTATIEAATFGDYVEANNAASDISKLLRLRVDLTSDLPDLAPGDGKCEAHSDAPPRCTLRAAVMEANAIAGIQTIELPVHATPYVLDRSSKLINGGQITITSGVKIVGEPSGGQAPQIVLDFPTTQPARAFRVNAAGTAYIRFEHIDLTGQGLAFTGDGGLVQHVGGKLVLRDVTLSNGRSTAKGGAIYAADELEMERVRIFDSTAARGGALAFEPPSFDFLIIHDSWFSGSGGADTLEGGALWINRALTGLHGVTLDNNQADYGGAVYLHAGSFGTLWFNSTVSNNIADLEGGGIWAGSGASLSTSTIADNAAAPGDNSAGLGGGIYVDVATTASTYMSIWSGNTAQVRDPGGPFPITYPHAAACHGTLDSGGYNSVDSVGADQLCTIVADTGDHLDSPSSLAALADNGGPTPTRALAANNQNLDLGHPDCHSTSDGTTPLDTDQRGEARPADGDGDGVARCDKGAFERVDVARVTVTPAGGGSGNVTSSPSAIFCGSTCSAAFAQGTEVTLTANPALGNRFTAWGGACSGTASTCTVTANGDVQVTAGFESTQSHVLDVSVGGAGGGSVSSTPGGIACPGDCSETYADGTSVTLQASADPGSAFVGWSGACTGTGTCTVTMTAAHTVFADFQASTLPLQVGTGGDGGGSVAGAGGSIACPSTCNADLAPGTPVSLTATADPGSQFQRWEDGPCHGSTIATCSFDLDSPTSMAAIFASDADPVLSLLIDGNGRVVSTPAGIDCTADCDADFARGSTVTLLASGSGSDAFGSWLSGPCAGSADPECTFVLDQGTVATALFVAAGVTPDTLFKDGFE